jgi:DNA repair exonuclease SbcCD ATPase subunit
MRIARAASHNFKGFERDFDQQFGDVNVISGRNEEGKTSILDLLSGLFVTDSSRTLLRVGAEEGWFSAVLEDATGRIEIRRDMTPEKISDPKIKREGGGNMGAYGRFIKEVVDTCTMDPIRRVMNAPPEEQVKILLQTMPLTLEPDALDRTIPEALLAALPDLPGIVRNAKRLPALDSLKAVEDYIYGQRRDITRDAKRMRAHSEELTASLGAAATDDVDWSAEVHRVLGQIQANASEETRIRIEAERDQTNLAQSHKDATAEAKGVIDKEIDAKIAALNLERKEAHARLDAAETENQERLQAEFLRKLEATENERRPIREQLKVHYDRAQNNASQRDRILKTREIAQTHGRDAGVLEARVEVMTAALTSVRALRAHLLETLPIKGLSFAAGQAYLDDVPLSEVNTATRAKFWVRVAAMRAMSKDLGIVLIDDAEHFDDINMPILIQQARASGLQFFITRVEPHPLRIECFDSTAEVVNG